jgi:MOSC domain-containing protein YiiM
MTEVDNGRVTETTGQLLAVNVGHPREIDLGKRTISTAIYKVPVAGRVAVRGVNLDGDEQADRKLHGGPDKAVYAYGWDDTTAWSEELSRDLRPGAFGENLTVGGLDVSGALIGERWAVGSTLLEVAQPRLPCFKLGIRMGDPHFVKRFGQAGRPGAYLRIVEEGDVGEGDAVEVVERPDHAVSMRLAAHAVLVDRSRLPELLEAPKLLPDWREWIVGLQEKKSR